MENSKQPAFASPGTYNPNNSNHNGDQQIGLTKREYFAGLAMQEFIGSYPEHIAAKHAVKCADALLIELDK